MDEKTIVKIWEKLTESGITLKKRYFVDFNTGYKWYVLELYVKSLPKVGKPVVYLNSHETDNIRGTYKIHSFKVTKDGELHFSHTNTYAISGEEFAEFLRETRENVEILHSDEL
jgi:uncharacterized protein YbgA (DUF1722 family)